MDKLKKSLDLCTKTYTPLAQPGRARKCAITARRARSRSSRACRSSISPLKPFSKAMNIQFRPLLNAGKSPLD